MDGEFKREVELFRRDLLAHCYRMLASLHDAEDAYQETLIRAWRGRDRFEGRSSLRTWLHRIATNVCLDVISDRKRSMPEDVVPASVATAALPDPDLDEPWLEPFPDALIGETTLGPEARYSARESVTIAFMIALQHLPGRQRAALLMRDVLGLSADETAEALTMTVPAANSALQRARATLEERGASPAAVPPLPDEATTALLVRYVRAWENGDATALVAILRDDAISSMPPLPLWFAGRAAVIEFFVAALAPRGPFRMLETAVNGQPAFGVYERVDGVLRFAWLSVVSAGPDGIRAIHTFLPIGGWIDPTTYGLPATL